MLFQLKKQHYGLTIGYFCLIFWLSFSYLHFFLPAKCQFYNFPFSKVHIFYFIFPHSFLHLSALISLLFIIAFLIMFFTICLANIWLIVFFPCIFIDFKGDEAATVTFCFWLCVCLFFLFFCPYL